MFESYSVPIDREQTVGMITCTVTWLLSRSKSSNHWQRLGSWKTVTGNVTASRSPGHIDYGSTRAAIAGAETCSTSSSPPSLGQPFSLGRMLSRIFSKTLKTTESSVHCHIILPAKLVCALRPLLAPSQWAPPYHPTSPSLSQLLSTRMQTPSSASFSLGRSLSSSPRLSVCSVYELRHTPQIRSATHRLIKRHIQ